jgi:hypothetical protein
MRLVHCMKQLMRGMKGRTRHIEAMEEINTY